MIYHLHESFRKSLKGLITSSSGDENKWKKWQQRGRRHWEKLASLALGLNREDRKAGESRKQVGRDILYKTLKKSWTFFQVAEKTSFCALSKPGLRQAALLSSKPLHHNFSETSLYVYLHHQWPKWVWRYHLKISCFYHLWVARLGKVTGSRCAMEMKIKALKHKHGMAFTLNSKGEIQQALLVH